MTSASVSRNVFAESIRARQPVLVLDVALLIFNHTILADRPCPAAKLLGWHAVSYGFGADMTGRAPATARCRSHSDLISAARHTSV